MITHSECLEKIIAKYSDNLPPEESVALNVHLLSCPECTQTAREYEELAICLRPLKEDTFATQLPPRMLALKNEIAETAKKKIQNQLIREADTILKESLESQVQKTSIDILRQTNMPQDEFVKVQLVKALQHEKIGNIQEGSSEFEKGVCNNSDNDWPTTKKGVIGKIGLVLSGLMLGGLALTNILLLPLNVSLVYHFFPLLTTSFPVFVILILVIYIRTLDPEHMRRYSDTSRAYGDLGRKYLKQPVFVQGHQLKFPKDEVDEKERAEREPFVMN